MGLSAEKIDEGPSNEVNDEKEKYDSKQKNKAQANDNVYVSVTVRLSALLKRILAESPLMPWLEIDNYEKFDAQLEDIDTSDKVMTMLRQIEINSWRSGKVNWLGEIWGGYVTYDTLKGPKSLNGTITEEERWDSLKQVEWARKQFSDIWKSYEISKIQAADCMFGHWCEKIVLHESKDLNIDKKKWKKSEIVEIHRKSAKLFNELRPYLDYSKISIGSVTHLGESFDSVMWENVLHKLRTWLPKLFSNL